MPAPNPEATEQFTETYNLKQLIEDAATFRRSLDSIITQSLQVHVTVMNALATSVQANQDIRDKLAAKMIELDIEQAVAGAALAQQAVKAAQTTPPPTP